MIWYMSHDILKYGYYNIFKYLIAKYKKNGGSGDFNF